jgi:hypothetical protein
MNEFVVLDQEDEANDEKQVGTDREGKKKTMAERIQEGFKEEC